MKANVKIAGVTYKDVPAVLIPDGSGKNVRFINVADTTASVADVAKGKAFYTSGGALATGTKVEAVYADYDATAF